jgi:nucleoside-diphosphate-sugar epimerase
VRVLVIGGTGFMGPRVAAALRRDGHDVIVFHRGKTSNPATQAGPREIIGDRRHLRDSADALRAFAPDVVIDMILSSARQARELMDLFRGVARRVVGVLHGSEPGPIEPVPLTESSPLRTKLQTYSPERIRMLQRVFSWLDEEYDKIPVEREVLGDAALPGIVLRLPMVYGPGDPLHRLFPLVRRMDDRRPVILFEEKHAAWRGPRGYVENVAAAIALAATTERLASPVFNVFNVGEADNVSELEWATHVARVVGWTGRFVIGPADRVPMHLHMPGNLDQHWATDTTRIRRELGYSEPIARDEAIRRTVEWERANRPPGVLPYPVDYDAEDQASGAIAASGA